MGQCVSKPGLQLAQMPTCQAPKFQAEIEAMSKITQVANTLAYDTFNALSEAKFLNKYMNLSPDQQSGMDQVLATLLEQTDYALNTVGELSCFNRTFDKWVKELAQLCEPEGAERSALLISDNLRTKDGYSIAAVKREVESHRKFVTTMATKGGTLVAEAVRTLNRVAAENGAQPVHDVSAIWSKAANPGSW